MTPFVVPQLLEKLKLLARNSGRSGVGDIATAFGISEDAVRYWTKETASQRAGTVPQQRVEGLLAMYGEALPDQTEANLIALLQGPTSDLEDAFRLQTSTSLIDLLAKSSDQHSGRLIPVDETGLGLVVANRLSRKAHCQFPLGRNFRLEFGTKHRGQHIVGLQKSPQAWGCVETALSSDKRIVHLPGATETGEFGSLDESDDNGVSTFYAIQSLRRFPAVFERALLDEVPLSRTDLSLLGQFIDDATDNEIHIMAFSVEFNSPVSS